MQPKVMAVQSERKGGKNCVEDKLLFEILNLCSSFCDCQKRDEPKEKIMMELLMRDEEGETRAETQGVNKICEEKIYNDDVW